MNSVIRRHWPRLAFLLTTLVCALMLAPLTLYAHGGGTPRLTNVPVGPYHLYAWSEPEPWRVGEVHLSLAVTQPNPEESSNQVEIPVTDVEITVTFTPVGDDAAAPIIVKAERQAFLGDFYFEADPILPHEGDWMIKVDVMGEEGSGEAEFLMEALSARAINWTLVASAAGVLVVLLALIAIWSRAQHSAEPARPQRGGRRVQPRRGQASMSEEA